MTKREFYTQAIAIFTEMGRGDLVEQANHEIDLLNRKAGYKSDKPTAKQVENGGIKDSIVAYLGTVDRATIGEIVAGLGGAYTSQRVSALVTQLKNSGVVVRDTEKRVAYFSLA